MVDVLGEVQGLHAAAGAEVQRAAERLAHGQLRQRRRGGADPEHVVGVDVDRGAVEAGREVADHPPVAAVVGVRAYVDPGADLVAGDVEQPGRRQRLHEAGQRTVGGLTTDG